MLIPTNNLLGLIIAGAIENDTGGTFTGPLYQPYVGLFTNLPSLNGNSKLSDLIEATYTGYARKHITTWSAPYVSQDGAAAVASLTNLFFQPTSPVTVENVVLGWFLADAGTAGNLLAAEILPVAAPLQTVTDALDLTVEILMYSRLGLGRALAVN